MGCTLEVKVSESHFTLLALSVPDVILRREKGMDFELSDCDGMNSMLSMLSTSEDRMSEVIFTSEEMVSTKNATPQSLSVP